MVTPRTKDETLRVATNALVPVIGRHVYREEAASAVLEAVGFFRLEEQRDALLAALNSVEWSLPGVDGETLCPCCESPERRGYEFYGHTDWCSLAAAIANAEAR